MLYTEDEKEFVAKANEYLQQVEKNQKVVLTKFLTLREQEILKDTFRKSHATIHFYGGYDQAERVRCLITNNDFTITDKLLNVRCFKIDYNKRFLKLTHQNVLGTLMSLKIDRSLFGDIVFDGDDCYFFTSSDIEAIILMEFISVNGVPIDVDVYEESLELEERYETKEIIVSSLRIDNLISHVYKLSRSDAQQLISGNHVYKNFQLLNNRSAICKKDDIISVRRYGRFIVGDSLRYTKSNKTVLEINMPTR